MAVVELNISIIPAFSLGNIHNELIVSRMLTKYCGIELYQILVSISCFIHLNVTQF